jgi:hypothetical protein
MAEIGVVRFASTNFIANLREHPRKSLKKRVAPKGLIRALTIPANKTDDRAGLIAGQRFSPLAKERRTS